MASADRDGYEQNPRASQAHPIDADVVLIGGGIMSATLGSMLSILAPEWRIVLLERSDALATESSGPWNNAGTGHTGFCELNYMPDPGDGAQAAAIARQFHLSRQWWSYLADHALLRPDTFIHPAAHMDVVFGHRDANYLRQRYETLAADPMFSGMRFSDDPATIERWAPLVMRGRTPGEPIAATLHPEDRCRFRGSHRSTDTYRHRSRWPAPVGARGPRVAPTYRWILDGDRPKRRGRLRGTHSQGIRGRGRACATAPATRASGRGARIRRPTRGRRVPALGQCRRGRRAHHQGVRASPVGAPRCQYRISTNASSTDGRM